MSNTQDSYQDLVAGHRDDEPIEGSGSGGAILGVLMTLVIGCGLVFAAYKLGQRTTVDEPPILTAKAEPARIVPEDEGGRTILNQDNDAYTMVDENTRQRVSYGEQDGIIVEQPLPVREIDPSTALGQTVAQTDALSIEELQPASSISGQPSLTDNSAPDRSGERQLAGGAEVLVADSEAVLRAGESAAEAAQGVQIPVGTPGVPANVETAALAPPVAVPAVPPLARAPDTTIAAPASLTPEDFGSALVVPVPRSKPDLIQERVAATRLAQSDTPATRTVAPAGAVVVTRGPVIVQPGIAPVAAPPSDIPAQPPGDAQVQLGAMPNPESVRARFRDLQSRNPDLLGALGLFVMPVQTAQGQQLFRLRVGPLSNTREAAALCEQLRFRGVECFVPRR